MRKIMLLIGCAGLALAALCWPPRHAMAANVDQNGLDVVSPAPYLPGGSNVTATPAASASAACTGLTGGIVYYITCDQTFRIRQGTGTPTATATDYGPIAANTHFRGRLGKSSTAIAFFNAGSATAACSCSAEVK